MELSGPTMGTTWSVKIVSPPSGFDKSVARGRVESVLENVNAAMSTYRDDSALSRFNRAQADEWVAVPRELAALVERAKTIGRQTGGAFDVTVGPLVSLWGFGPELGRNEVPADRAIAERLRLVGSERVSVRVEPPAMRKPLDGMRVDLSAMAKGYGVDRIAEALSGIGVERFLVEIGGELYGHGKNADGEAWRVGVERPEAGGARRVAEVVALDGAGMATSGDYRNFFEIDGKRYSHTLDPATGWPVTHDLRSVTVIAADTARADALATALLVMGPSRGPAFANERDMAALFIQGEPGQYTVRRTKAFESHAR